MGWIKRAIRNLSIKKTFMLFMLLFLLLAALLSSITINIAGNIRNTINLSYSDTDNKFLLENSNAEIIIGSTTLEYTQEDSVTIMICGFVEIWSIPIFFGLCIMLSALLFYRHKLKKPIELLSGASEKIAGNNLNFHLSYDSMDEMGRLCASFETMRASLEENNRQLWRTVEERKRLNAAFSHDLRTPLTVLRGYTDLLKNYIPKGKISDEKMMSTVSTMSGQIARLESYVQMMSEVQKLEDITVLRDNVDAGLFSEQLKGTAELLAKRTDLQYNFANEILDGEVCIDSSIILRVYENLIENALRYANSTVNVRCGYSDGMFAVSVTDDGKGFTGKDLKQADKPYYGNQPNANDIHFGLGLTICKILCKKHGGSLLLENGKDGGACVTASFNCIG